MLINLSQAHEEKREGTQINKIRNERGEKTINTKKIEKNSKIILWIVIWKWIRQPRRNRQVSRKI